MVYKDLECPELCKGATIVSHGETQARCENCGVIFTPVYGPVAEASDPVEDPPAEAKVQIETSPPGVLVRDMRRGETAETLFLISLIEDRLKAEGAIPEGACISRIHSEIYY